MKTSRTQHAMLILLLAALAVLPLASGCGGGGGGGAASLAGGDAPPADGAITDGSGGELVHGFMPDGTAIVEDETGLRQSLRIVGDPGCTANRSFSKARILPGTSATVTVTISGCTGNLESMYFASEIPTDIGMTTVSVKVNGANVPYVYEAPTATSTYHHWVLDDVPVDGGVELPAGGTFQLVYRVTDDGLHPDDYVYDFKGFLWVAHDIGTSANVWGYSDGGFNLTVGLPPLGASGGPDMNTYYVSDKAFDGDYKSWWAGLQNYGRWDLYYRFPASQFMSDLFINFFSTAHLPATVNVYWSNDGVNWTLAGAMPPLNAKPHMALNQTVTFLWFEMIGNPSIGYPLIRDVDWLPVTESKAATGGLGFGPSQNPDWYFPSNAFDNDMNSWWAGQTGAGAWDIYYHFNNPQQIVGPVTIYYYSTNHKPTTTTVYYSNDGVAWTAGEPASAPGATATVVVARKANYIRLAMTGNPAAGFPLVKDMTWAVPEGASGGVSFNAFYAPSKAFDADPLTQWAGRPNDGKWYLFYGYPAPHAFTNIKIWFFAANYVPSTQVNVYYSNDGKTWTLSGAMPAFALDPIAGAPSAVSSTLAMNVNAKFVCLELLGNPAITFPIIPYSTM